MNLDQEVEILKQISLFKNVETAPLKFLAFAAERVHFNQNDTIIQKDTPATGMFILLNGGNESVIGERAMLKETCHASTITATSPFDALYISKDLFFQTLIQFPQMSIEIIKNL